LKKLNGFNLMKIVHTADWHLGQRLYTKDREQEHRIFFDQLIQIFEEEGAEVLVVAGDIFDIGFPSNASLQIYYETLTRLFQTSCQHVVIIGGNHDSVNTLNAPKDILKFMNVSVVGGTTENLADEIVEIQNNDGKLQLVVAAVPFLRDKDVRQSLAGESFADKTKAIREGILLHYQQIAELVAPYKNRQVPIIATGHLTATGASSSDSEREIHIGNLGAVEIDQFPDVFDYVALGHLHRPQMVGGNAHIRYSGSPIALSFSERKDNKSILLLETSDGKIQNIRTIPLSNARKLLAFSGSFNDVTEKVMAYSSDSLLNDWAELQITTPHYDPSLLPRVEEFVAKTTHIEILKFRLLFEDQVGGTDELFQEYASLSDLAETDVFDKMLAQEEIQHKEQLSLAFRELLQLIRDEEHAV